MKECLMFAHHPQCQGVLGGCYLVYYCIIIEFKLILILILLFFI